MHPWLILLAAGSGSRLALATHGLAKQFLLYHDQPLYWHCIKNFSLCPKIGGIILVLPEEDFSHRLTELENLKLANSCGLPIYGVKGGKLRQDSVYQGLLFLKKLEISCPQVLIHDSARPFASPALINRVIDGLDKACGVIPGIKVKDTIKQVQNNFVNATFERESLIAVQTPQAFHTSTLIQAHIQAQEQNWQVTDDASLLEKCGHQVIVVEGETQNQKITTPEDLIMLEHKVQTMPITCHGYDVHRYVQPEEPKARPLKLGGVLIPKAPCVSAHSDGDVLFHALADAMLACASSEDIGQIFPDTEPANNNMDSAIIIAEAMHRLDAQKIYITHIDLTIIAQKPKISPYTRAIKDNIASILSLSKDQVSLKATTEEGLGFTGELKGIKAIALVSVIKPR